MDHVYFFFHKLLIHILCLFFYWLLICLFNCSVKLDIFRNALHVSHMIGKHVSLSAIFLPISFIIFCSMEVIISNAAKFIHICLLVSSFPGILRQYFSTAAL